MPCGIVLFPLGLHQTRGGELGGGFFFFEKFCALLRNFDGGLLRESRCTLS